MRQWCKSSWEIFKPQAIRVWKGVEAAARAPHRQATRRRRLVKLLFTRFSLTRAFVYLIPTTHTLDDSPLRFHETTSPFVCTEKPAKTIRLVYYSWFSRPPPPTPPKSLAQENLLRCERNKKKGLQRSDASTRPSFSLWKCPSSGSSLSRRNLYI